MSDEQVTLWLRELEDADHDAAGKLWQHFFIRLHALGRNAIDRDTRRTYDEDDAAQSAFISFCNGMAAGRFPDLKDRNGLWRLLLVITLRKIHQRHKYDHREKRDVRRLSGAPNGEIDGSPADFVSREPTPEIVAEFRDTCDHLHRRLENRELQAVVELKLNGYTDHEIAEKLGSSRRTVQRRLEIIRRRWNHVIDESCEPAEEI